MTQKQIIIKYLQQVNQWIPAYRLRGLSTPYGFCGHQADRRARELAAEGKLEHKIEDGYAWYKAKPLQYRQLKVLDELGNCEKILTLPI